MDEEEQNNGFMSLWNLAIKTLEEPNIELETQDLGNAIEIKIEEKE